MPEPLIACLSKCIVGARWQKDAEIERNGRFASKDVEWQIELRAGRNLDAQVSRPGCLLVRPLPTSLKLHASINSNLEFGAIKVSPK